MKQRMYNVFFRITKSAFVARVLSSIGFYLLKLYYHSVVFFFKRSKNQINLTDCRIEYAKNKLYQVYVPADMLYIPHNLDKNENIDLSIILPVYNAEEYILEAVRSILNQKTKYTYELIIVNDGSTDQSGEKIKEINHSAIRYIKQKNMGHSGARNTGIDHAVGKYIMFVDSDDILCEDSIEKMLSSAYEENADIVVGSYYHFYNHNDAKQYFILDDELITKQNRMIGNPGYPWGKIYRRELFNKVRFPMNSWFEDTIICSVVYRLCKRMVVIKDIVYGYRENPGSVTRQARKSVKALDHLWVMNNAISQSDENGLPHDEILYGLAIGHFSTLLYRRLSLLNEDIIREAFIVACSILKEIKPKEHCYSVNKIKKDIEKSFETGNYKLWKLASFIV